MRQHSALAFALCALIGSAGPLWAQQNPVVVELYTSQGCAACPPADELLNQMADHDAILPLALHVDYWDYIGWADTFGKTAFSERQKAYAREMGRKSVYTPQMVIGGVDDVQGNATMQVMAQIAEHRMNPVGGGRVSVQITARDGGGVTITAQSPLGLDHAVDVQLVRFLNEATVEILAGENEGRFLTYRNIVTDWNMLGAWDGLEPFNHTVTENLPQGSGMSRSGARARSVWPVLGAARLIRANGLTATV